MSEEEILSTLKERVKEELNEKSFKNDINFEQYEKFIDNKVMKEGE